MISLESVSIVNGVRLCCITMWSPACKALNSEKYIGGKINCLVNNPVTIMIYLY